jgi:hypothetical protein
LIFCNCLLFREGKIPFICGGTNYYIESLLWKILIDEETPLLLERKRKLDLPNHSDNKEAKPQQKNENTDDLNIDLVDFDHDDETLSTGLLYQKLQVKAIKMLFYEGKLYLRIKVECKIKTWQIFF